MPALHTGSLEYWHSISALAHVIIFVQRACSVATKWYLFSHFKLYGILLSLKCSVTIDFPNSNGTGSPTSFLISISMVSKHFFWSGTYMGLSKQMLMTSPFFQVTGTTRRSGALMSPTGTFSKKSQYTYNDEKPRFMSQMF